MGSRSSCRREDLHPARAQRHDPAEAEGGRGGVPGREGHRGGHHRPGVLRRHQRQATKDAGRIAGLDVKRIINEPTASALAYGLDRKHDEKIAVYDLGGGTFDISILELGEGASRSRRPMATPIWAATTFDQRVIEWLLAEFKRDQGIDLRTDQQALQRLKEAAEKAKIELSTTTTTEINLPHISRPTPLAKHLVIALSRAKLEDLTADLIDKTRGPVSQAIRDSGLKSSEIDEIVLVGGQTRMPAVIEAVKQMFGGKEPHRGVNPDEVVAVAPRFRPACSLARSRTSCSST